MAVLIDTSNTNTLPTLLRNLLYNLSRHDSIFKSQLQLGECGIMFTYGATGSLIKREFICNNTGVAMNRTAKGEETKGDSIKTSNKNEMTEEEIVKATAIMPNPTSGKFTLRLGKALNNENVLLMDVNGKVIQNSTKSGTDLNFDISSYSSGIYFVKIESDGKAILLKIIKQ
jgi:hypothetical protein